VPEQGVREDEEHVPARRWETRLVAVGLGAALFAAVAVLLLDAVITGEWKWLAFGEDLVRNLFVGALLAVVTVWFRRRQDAAVAAAAAAVAREQEKARIRALQGITYLAGSGWSSLEGDPATAADVRARLLDEAPSLRRGADRLEEVYHRANDDECPAMVDVSDVADVVWSYIAEGSRTRRLLYLGYLERELAALERAVDDGLATAVSRFRRSVPALLGWRQHTDTTVVEHMLVEQTILPNHRGTPDPSYVELLRTAPLSDAAPAFEPLYLLYAFAMKQAGVAPATAPRSLLDPVLRSIGALRNEMRAAALCVERLAEILDRTEVGLTSAVGSERA
jgi:hypothetical protein